jgi:hypothetical protein
MMRNLQRLTEARIKAAEAKGELRDLAGAGKPLPKHPEEALLDPGIAIGHRIMAEAGALPEEIGLKRQIEAAKATYRAATSAEDRKAAMKRIAELELKHAIASEARRKFLGG